MEFRKSLFLLFAFVGSLVSHSVGGGSFISPARLLSELALISGAMLTLRGREYEGPALALAILIVQSTAHFILGGANNSGSQMLFAHVVGGVLSYNLITHFDRIWADICSLLASLILKVAKRFDFSIPDHILLVTEFPREFTDFSHKDFSRRGPPCN
jgi:hypothetical protein